MVKSTTNRPRPPVRDSQSLALPSARTRLMALPSFSRSPVAPVESARSLPARSMRLMIATWSRNVTHATHPTMECIVAVAESQPHKLPRHTYSTTTRTLSVALPASTSTFVCVSTIWKMVCARDDVAFICVDATVRALVPASISLSIDA